MTNAEIIQAIRNEIERLKNYAEESKKEWVKEGYNQNAFAEDCRISSFDKLLSFLSTLEEQTKGYDESYIQSKIAKASETWKGVDVDEYLSQVRGEVRNPIFDECVANVDPEVREEVRENIDFEQALYDHFGQVKDFTLGMRIGKYFYELGCTRTAEQFEKNRLAACDNMSKEEYDRETDFVDSIIKKEHRQPTFSDAINYGMRLQPLPEDTVIYQKGVEEGKRLMMDEWLKDRDGCFWDGVAEGKKAMREQMLKEARNHFVYNILSGNDMKKMIEIYNDEADCRPGDVVRVIIVKEDEK